MDKLATAARDREKDKRQDLSVMAQSYIVLLTKRGSLTTSNSSSNNERESNGTRESNNVREEAAT